MRYHEGSSVSSAYYVQTLTEWHPICSLNVVSNTVKFQGWKYCFLVVHIHVLREIPCVLICKHFFQDDEEEQQAAKLKSKKSNKSQKKAAFNPFDQIETGGAGGDDGGDGGGDDGYNPFADFMAGVSSKAAATPTCLFIFLKGSSSPGRAEKVNGSECPPEQPPLHTYLHAKFSSPLMFCGYK